MELNTISFIGSYSRGTFVTPDFSRHLHVINHPIRSNLLGLLVVYGGSRVIQQLRAIVGFHSPDTDNLRDMNPPT